MGRAMQIRPARVLETVTLECQSGILAKYRRQNPPWIHVLHRVPPAAKVAHTVPVVHRPENKKMKKPRRTFIPQQIKFPEDALRTIFYKHHPWELARPRIMAETDGRDLERVDWSAGLRQPGMPLCGESVVQRQLWLMENEGMPQDQAYDMVRKEFYDLRQQEQIEQRVAREEATHVGGYFGKTRLEIGLGVEDGVFEDWKTWAAKQIALSQASARGGAGVAMAPEPEKKKEEEPAGDKPSAPRMTAPRTRMPISML